MLVHDTRHALPFILVAALVAAPEPVAAQSKKSCAPADSTFGEFGTVYSACEVDKQARLRGQLRPAYNPSNPASIPSCLKTVVDVVVDENGLPIVPSVRLVSTTDRAHGEAVMEAVRTAKFQAAQKEGNPVRQVIRLDHGGVVSQRVTVGAVSGAATPMQRSPC